LVSLLSAPLVVGTVAWFARRIRRTARRRQEQLGEVTQRLVDILAGIKVIKAFGGEGLEELAFRREAAKLFRRDMKVVKNRIFSRSLVEFVTGITGIGMLALGAWLVIRGMWGITPGTVAAFATVLATTYRPVKTLSRGWARLSEALASAERFYEILDMQGEIPDREDAVPIDGVNDSICFRDVCFHYAGDNAGNNEADDDRLRERELVLDNINLKVAAGEVIAVVGRSGEGKTTLVDLLMRFHDPSSGSIEIDGRDLRGITRDSLMAQVAIVSQEPFLFDTTILENIRYGRPDASKEEIEQTAAIARVDEFVSQLPLGYETEVGEFGVRLSGGQRQRIGIARALAVDPDILLMDEPFGALDAITRTALQDELLRIWKETGKSILFVTHDIEEAVFLGDRVLLLGDSPAHIVKEYRTTIDRSERRDGEAFQQQVGRVRSGLESAIKTALARDRT